MPRAKLICTLGPSTSTEKTFMGLVSAGMNVARLNFSHETYDEFRKRIAMVRAVSEKTGCPITILGDLCVLSNDLLDGRWINLGSAHDHHFVASTEDSAFERKRAVDHPSSYNVSGAIAQEWRSGATERGEDQFPILSFADGLSRNGINDLGDVGSLDNAQRCASLRALVADRADFGHAVMIEDTRAIERDSIL